VNSGADLYNAFAHSCDDKTAMPRFRYIIACGAYAGICGAAIGLLTVWLVSFGLRWAWVPFILCGIAPFPVALQGYYRRWTTLLLAGGILLVELATVNVVASCTWHIECGRTVLPAVTVGFILVYPIITLPVTLFAEGISANIRSSSNAP
jgi:hypothetical protein